MKLNLSSRHSLVIVSALFQLVKIIEVGYMLCLAVHPVGVRASFALELLWSPDLASLRSVFRHVSILSLQLKPHVLFPVRSDLKRIESVALKLIFSVQVHVLQGQGAAHLKSSGSSLAQLLDTGYLRFFTFVLLSLLLFKLVQHRDFVVCVGCVAQT